MRFSPTTDNFSTLAPTADYTVDLPDISINLEPPKSISTARTISGGSAISVWESSIEGAQIEFQMSLKKSKYLTLKRMKDSGIDLWLWQFQGKIFEVVFDLSAARRLPGKVELWQCLISLTISAEVN